MKWLAKEKEIIENESGDKRTRTSFLLIPHKIGNEWRWLEKAKWEEECDVWYGNITGREYASWDYVRWIND